MTSLLQRVGSLLYLVSPNATRYQHEDEIPNYVDEVNVFVVVFLYRFIYIMVLIQC